MLDDLGDGLVDHVRERVQEGHELRITFDNFDFQILTNIIVKGYQNSDMHWITQFITFERVSSANLNDTRPLIQDINDFDNTKYLLSKRELEDQRWNYIVLVSRVLVEYFSCLKSLKNVVPKHIKHQYSQEMAKASEIISLSVVPYNQNKIGDVCQYLSYLTQFLVKVFNTDQDPLPPHASAAEEAEKASRVLKGHHVPLVGDLLGRKRVTGAKQTQAVWHANQSF